MYTLYRSPASFHKCLVTVVIALLHATGTSPYISTYYLLHDLFQHLDNMGIFFLKELSFELITKIKNAITSDAEKEDNASKYLRRKPWTMMQNLWLLLHWTRKHQTYVEDISNRPDTPSNKKVIFDA